jgi:hypothetical protein
MLMRLPASISISILPFYLPSLFTPQGVNSNGSPDSADLYKCTLREKKSQEEMGEGLGVGLRLGLRWGQGRDEDWKNG